MTLTHLSNSSLALWRNLVSFSFRFFSHEAIGGQVQSSGSMIVGYMRLHCICAATAAMILHVRTLS